MKNHFEGRVDERLAIQKGYERAETVLAKDAIQPADFTDVHSDTHKDILWAHEMEKKFAERLRNASEAEQESYKLAIILEAIIHEEGEKSEWFGSTAMTTPAAQYDDYKNGVDELIEFGGHEEPSFLGLAIDVSSGSDLTKKLTRIRDEIDTGTLATMKYFQSVDGSVREERLNIPRVVIGADRKVVRELMELWLNNDRQALARHTIQIKLLEEVRMQLITFSKYAERCGHAELVHTYHTASNTINDVLRSKRRVFDVNTDEFNEDEVFYSLKENLRSFEQKLAA